LSIGKTLQVIALISTLLVNSDQTKTNRIIILSPKNVTLNWRAELQKWLKDCEIFYVFDITASRTLKDRLNVFQDWFLNGGVLILGYTMFANLINGKRSKEENDKKDIEKYLINPGCNLLICDEGHILKNSKSALAQSVNSVNTRRRIVLTGSPLQNNLEEYHCMVSLVKPNLLGSIKEFRNRFVNPINNGHFSDSTERDVKIMKQRAHVLHKTLIGCVQRMDYTVIKPYIPPKQEYVIYIRLSELQQNLYKKYIENTFTNKNVEKEAIVGAYSKNKGIQLLTDYHELSRIWSHPWALVKKSDECKKPNDSKKVNNDDDEFSSFCEEIDSDQNNDEEEDKSLNSKKPKEIDLKIKKELFVDNDSTSVVNNEIKKQSEELDKWWINMIDDNEIENNVDFSGKMVLLFEVLRFCEHHDEKLIVFSQSIATLNLIEKFIKNIKLVEKIDYFRIDGDTQSENRKKYINMFNDVNNRVRLFLIR
jgi:transcriptional regulator ATRX